MKRILSAAMSLALCLAAFSGCGGSGTTASSTPAGSGTPASSEAAPAPAPEKAKSVELTVVTSFGGDDGNRGNYEEAVKAYEDASGNTVIDQSSVSNEEWKARVMADFETGTEPDVLFYFNGVDANKLIEGGKVVSVEEIRKVYPEYASNMKDEMLGASPVDSKNYSVPVNGIWEALYVNKTVLEACGVAVPGADYTWDQFLKDCQTIKDKGYTPIACSLQEVPHYWFEYATFNNGNVSNHATLPESSSDEFGKIWAAGFADMKDLFEKGFFAANTVTAKDPETFQLMAEDKAAFAIDGNWKMGWFRENVTNIDNYTVTYVPGKGDRKATDIIAGLTMGYYITQKAWDDPEKQKACVEFITSMTTDEVVSKFGPTSVTALKNGTIPPADADSMTNAALALTKGATGAAPAVQDGLNSNARAALFADVKNIVTGKTTAEAAIDNCLAVKAEA